MRWNPSEPSENYFPAAPDTLAYGKERRVAYGRWWKTVVNPRIPAIRRPE